jgi:hypothetical protein
MNTIEMIISLIVGIIIAFLGMAGIDRMLHKEPRDQSWDEIYQDAREGKE